MEKPIRDDAAVQREIEMLLATVDGLSNSDAFRLGVLTREYAEAIGADVLHEALGHIFGEMRKEAQRKAKPWES